jgi:mannose-6-phosphate isomerase-like protein (cupin superfamily)
MSTQSPIHTSRRPPLRCLPRDAAAIVLRLPHVPVEREIPGSVADRRLDDLISKPWGVEFRVYDDALLDVWMLHLRPETRTSMHCHPRKDTLLLCVSGYGYMTTGDGRDVPIEPGDVLTIQQGAAHRSTAATAMTLVEVETPRDKYDLVRLQDDAGREGRGYERTRTRHPVRIAAVAGGPPRARLRPRCADRPFAFDLETGRDLRPRLDGLAFAISLCALGVLRREIAVGTPDDLGAIADHHLCLTIRSTHKEQST